jgi:hypothetical protein
MRNTRQASLRRSLVTWSFGVKLVVTNPLWDPALSGWWKRVIGRTECLKALATSTWPSDFMELGTRLITLSRENLKTVKFEWRKTTEWINTMTTNSKRIKEIRMVTWNIRSLYTLGGLRITINELKKYKKRDGVNRPHRSFRVMVRTSTPAAYGTNKNLEQLFYWIQNITNWLWNLTQ